MTNDKKSLVALTDDLRDLFDLAGSYEAEDQDLPADIADKLSEALTAQAEKVDRCAAFIARSKAEIEWLKNEKKVIDTQINRIEGYIKRMMSLAEFVMKKEGTRKLEGMHGHSFSFRKSESVVIEDEDQLPGRYRVKKVSFAPDKKTIKDALKSGLSVPGATLEVRDNVQSK